MLENTGSYTSNPPPPRITCNVGHQHLMLTPAHSAKPGCATPDDGELAVDEGLVESGQERRLPDPGLPWMLGTGKEALTGGKGITGKINTRRKTIRLNLHQIATLLFRVDLQRKKITGE